MTLSETARRLPDASTLRRRLQSLAALDAILASGEYGRYHSFDPNWDKEEELAFLNNGSGDEHSHFRTKGHVPPGL